MTEITSGIAKLKRTGSSSKATALGDWLELVLHLYGERVLAFDVPAACLAGELADRAHAAGRSPGFADVAIAATAGIRRLTILTHNLRHFTPIGVAAIDPLEMLS